MIIQCQGCAAKYFLSEDKVPEIPTKVRCPKCTAVFTLVPQPEPVTAGAPAAAPAAPSAPPVVEPVPLPVQEPAHEPPPAPAPVATPGYEEESDVS